MATWQNPKGDIDFHGTRNSIITRALRICSAIADTEVPTPSMSANGAEALNALCKQWDAMGIHLWTTTEGVVFPQPHQYRYLINTYLPQSSNPDRASANWRMSTLSQNYVAGSRDLFVHTPWTDYGQTDLEIGDEIGFVGIDGRVHWTLITYHEPLTINPLPNAANAGAPVFMFRFRMEQPLRIVSARRFIICNRIDTPLLHLARLDYQEMPNKETCGTPSGFFYDPQLFTGYFHLWPSPQDVCSLYRITYYRRMQDLNDPNDVPDLPQEWSNALTWNLAKEIAPEYDVPIAKYAQIIIPRAAETLDMVQGFDKEPEAVYFGAAFTPNSR